MPSQAAHILNAMLFENHSHVGSGDIVGERLEDDLRGLVGTVLGEGGFELPLWACQFLMDVGARVTAQPQGHVSHRSNPTKSARSMRLALQESDV